jgi:hypothetical protein
MDHESAMRPVRPVRALAFVAMALALPSMLPAQRRGVAEPVFYAAMGAPPNPKVEVAWNRFRDNAGLGDLLRRLAEAHPHVAKFYSVGKSHEGRPIWCLEVTARSVGDPDRKPAMHIDGNIHGNEAQAGEVVAYTAWYLCENYGRVPKITELVNERTFYLMPSINPDGRDNWFRNTHQPHNAHTSRGGVVPTDNDGDGLFDEDGFDDLDGDGQIGVMRRRDPLGRHKAHPDFPDLMIDAKPDEPGEYLLLGWEGVDNDGDGQLNEDGAGGYDPNRNWAWNWQPEYAQYGAGEYPFWLPETRAVADFALERPNIAAAQSYHNYGGMILHGPGTMGAEVSSEDAALMKLIGKRGEEMLPFYRSMNVFADLYPARGLEIDWFYGNLGAVAYTNELWTGANYHRVPEAGNFSTDEVAERRFVRDVLFDQPALPWKPVDHPTYGPIEVGGYAKSFGRMPPSFMLEEECHRNMAFTLYHADQMPRLEWGEIAVAKAPGGLRRLRVEVRNTRLTPTRLGLDVKHGINRPDLLTVSPANAVVAGGLVESRWSEAMTPQKYRPHRLEVATLPGNGAVWAEFLIKGDQPVEIVYDSVKGGVLRWTSEKDAVKQRANSNLANISKEEALQILENAKTTRALSRIEHGQNLAQLDKAYDLFAQGKHAEALAALEKLQGAALFGTQFAQAVKDAQQAQALLSVGEGKKAQEILDRLPADYADVPSVVRLREQIASAQGSNPQGKAERLFQEGREHARFGRYEEALRAFYAARQADSSHAEAVNSHRDAGISLLREANQLPDTPEFRGEKRRLGHLMIDHSFETDAIHQAAWQLIERLDAEQLAHPAP